MIRRSSFVLAAVVGLSVLIPSGAESQLRPWEISIAGGPSIPTGDLANEANTGFHVQGSVGFDLPLLPFGTRLDALWQEVPDVEDGWFRQIGVLANATFGIPLVFIQPYALVGAGWLRTETPDVEHGDHAHDGATENLIGFNAGAGLDFPFAGLGGFVEARVLNIFGGGDATSFRTIPISIGIRF